jgi:hypothetical protein
LTSGSSGSLFFDRLGLLGPLGVGRSGAETEAAAAEGEVEPLMMASPLLAGALTGAGGVMVTEEDRDGTTDADTDRKCDRFRTLEIFSIPLGALPDAARACAASFLSGSRARYQKQQAITIEPRG